MKNLKKEVFNILDILVPTMHKINPATGVEYVEELIDSLGNGDFEIILEENNKSFPKAINNMLKKCTDRDVLILNDDIVATEGWFEKITEHAPGPITGFKLNYVSKPDVIQHAGGALRWDWAGTHIGQGQLDVGQFDTFYPCVYVTFAAVLLRKPASNAIGLLTEEFGRIYFEDVDYCLRAWQLGYGVSYSGDIEFLHHESPTMKEDPHFQAIWQQSFEAFKRKWAKPETIKLLKNSFKGYYGV